jgi:hypothetical protein
MVGRLGPSRGYDNLEVKLSRSVAHTLNVYTTDTPTHISSMKRRVKSGQK